MPAEQPILGLRTGEKISAVRDRVRLGELVRSVQDRRPATLDGINRGLESAIGARIPIEFLIESGLSDLAWQQVWHRNAMTALFLGFDQASQDQQSYSQAEAVIAFHARTQIVKEPLIEHGFVIKPASLEVSSVQTDTAGVKRIVHGRYSPETLIAFARHVSFDALEEMVQPRGYQFPQDDLKVHRFPTEGILAEVASPRTEIVYPLVTQRMLELVGQTTLADAGSWQTHIRDHHREATGHEFVTRVGKGPIRAWDIMLPRMLEVAA